MISRHDWGCLQLLLTLGASVSSMQHCFDSEVVFTHIHNPLCYTEKAPNAWHRRGIQKRGNTYNQPNRPPTGTPHIPSTKHYPNPLCDPLLTSSYLVLSTTNVTLLRSHSGYPAQVYYVVRALNTEHTLFVAVLTTLVLPSPSSCSVPTWCVVCGVHPPASDRGHVGMVSPSCLPLRSSMVAPPTDGFRFFPGALACF